MKITAELLKKYATNTCSAQERQAVESWLKDTASEVPQITDEQWEKADALMRADIGKQISRYTNPVVPMYKKWMRYASAACVATLIFFAGRYSANENTSLLPQQSSTQASNNLLVYGGNGAYAKIPGNAFSLQFDGKLRLYNGSKEVKTISVGNKKYTLEPMHSYMLIGNNKESSLIAGLDYKFEAVGLDKPKGDFGIRVLKA